MAITVDWSVIENDPDFRSLPLERQRKWREEWIESMVRGRGQLKPSDREKARREYEAIAFATLPKEQWPSTQRQAIMPRTPTQAFLSITPGEILHHTWHGVGRGFGLPQQIIANILQSPKSISERGALGPLKNIYEYVGEGKEVEVPGGILSKLATDPWLWATFGTGGLSLLLRGKSIPEIMSIAQRNPRLAPTIEWYLRQISKGALGQPLSQLKGPVGLEEVGIIKLTPEQEKIVSTITKNPQFKKVFKSPKELQSFAELYARSSPTQRKKLLSDIKDPMKLIDVKFELREIPSRRTQYTYPPHTQSTRPPTVSKKTKTVVEDVNNPESYRKLLDEYLKE